MIAGGRPPRHPGVRLTAGALLIGVAFAIEIWQEQDVYTITQLYTLPAFAFEIVGAILVLSASRRWLRASRGPRRLRAAATCGVGGTLLWVGVLASQLGFWTDGDSSALVAYASFVLLFLGVGLIAGAVSAGVAASDRGIVPAPDPAKSRVLKFRHPGIGLPVGIVGIGGALLAALWLSLGRIDLAVTLSDPIYALYAIELGGSAAWLLYAGADGLFRVAPQGALPPLRRAAAFAGVVLIVLAALWRLTSTVYPELAFLVLAMTTLAGVLLLIAAVRPRRAPSGARGARGSLPQ